MTPPTLCLECNAPLTPADAGGLCPKCLLRLGLAGQFDETAVADAGGRALVPPPRFPFDFGGYRVLRLLGRGGMGAIAVEVASLDAVRAAAARFISYRSAALIRDPRFDEITRDVLDETERSLARRAVQENPSVTPQEFTAAVAIAQPLITETRTYLRNGQLAIGPGCFLGGLMMIAIIHFISVLLFRTGPGLRMFGLAIVDRTGRPAGRLRLLARGAIVWLPAPLVALTRVVILRLESTEMTRTLLAVSLILGALTLLAGALWSALRPAAGPHDRFAGTCVVPR